MTGSEGDQHHGYWEVLEADAPRRLVFRDGFANADGTPNSDLPRSILALSPHAVANLSI
jgi:hypothetical protein